ncbi:transmembrane amino acid transporter [Xylaria sp. CBS 124048]|nr:transmembrane amino acid transporter [Xylaria sp. CBS 124048]
MPGRQPATWAEYRLGASPSRRRSSTSSAGHQSVASERDSLLRDAVVLERDDGESPQLRRRRSSATNALTTLTDIGGVNSIRSFSRSFHRAAAFPEIIPQQPSFVFPPDQQPLYATDIETENAIVDTDQEDAASHSSSSASANGRRAKRKNRLGSVRRGGASPSNSARRTSIFSTTPLLFAPPLLGSYGSTRSYSTVGDPEAQASHASMREAADFWRQRRESGANLPDGERPPILVREVEQDGKIVLAVSGQSTFPQTIVNSTNVLIGIGLLSLPMGLKYAGWVIGIIAMVLCGIVTNWTARLLSRCMDLDPTIITFSDIAYISFGSKARVATAFLFTLELLAACVALVVLFADSLASLFPGTLTLTGFKILFTLILIPLQFAPLSLLSVTSFVGIFCCLGIGVVVVLDGLIKQTAPGSLIQPAVTHLFPENWLALPLSFGLLMSPWGGHSVFPNIYRDMRHPQKFKQALNYTFSFTMLVDASVAIVGLLMFGDGVRDEITANIFETTGYPDVLNILLIIFIAVIPLTKVPLAAQPIITTAEVLFGLQQQPGAIAEVTSCASGLSNTSRGLLKALIKVTTALVFLAISIIFPAFDSIMAFMGSALCFSICVTLPIAFYLRLFAREIATGERILCWSILLVSLAISATGTVWAFLPKKLIGAE